VFLYFPAIIQYHTIPLKIILEAAAETAKIRTVIGSMQERLYFSFVM